MKKEDIEAIKIRADKFLSRKETSYSDIMKLCETILFLKKENSFLSQSLFELQQVVPEDQQWENILATKLAKALISSEKDFVEITNSINNQTFVISIQKKFGKTPVQLVKQSEIRRLKASKKILNLSRELKNLRGILRKKNVELQVLSQIGFPSIDEELVNRENIDITMRSLKKLITNYNSTVYRRWFPQLHISMKEVVQEAFTRAAHNEWKYNDLHSKFKNLTKEFLKRKSINCRIYKKQRRKKQLKRRLVLHY